MANQILRVATGSARHLTCAKKFCKSANVRCQIKRLRANREMLAYGAACPCSNKLSTLAAYIWRYSIGPEAVFHEQREPGKRYPGNIAVELFPDFTVSIFGLCAGRHAPFALSFCFNSAECFIDQIHRRDARAAKLNLKRPSCCYYFTLCATHFLTS
jgi:hypothetical protein